MFFDRFVGIICIVLSLCLPGQVHASIAFGLAKDAAWNTSDHLDLAEQYGATGHYTVYWNLLSPENLAHPFDWVRDNYMVGGCKPVIVTLLFNGETEHSLARSELSEVGDKVIGNHESILDGKYDDAVRAFAQRAKKAMAQTGCSDVTISIMHEGDGSWYAWGMDAVGNSAQSYAKAFIHVVEILREEKVDVKIQLNPNRRDGKFQVMRLIDEWFPLIDPYVDVYAISSYNRCGTQESATEYRSFWQEFGPAYQKLSSYTDKPINVAETSTSTLCRDEEDKLLWFKEMFSALAVYAPQTERVTFYFGTIEVGAASNDVPIVWGFPTSEGRQAFRDILQTFQEAKYQNAPDQSVVVRTVYVDRPVSPVANTAEAVSEAPLKSDSDISSSGGWQPSYAGWYQAGYVLGDEPIPGYGNRGFLAQGGVRYSLLKSSGEWEFGPSLNVGGVISDQCEVRFWQCKGSVSLSFVGKRDTRDPFGFGDYNSVLLEAGVRYELYPDLGGRPDRLDNGDLSVFVGISGAFGGDFKK